MIAALDARKSTLLAVAVLVTGCAPSLTEIREQTPRRAVFAGHYDAVSLCVLDALDRQAGIWNPLAGATHRYVERRQEQRGTVMTIVDRGMMTPIPVSEITSTQTGSEVMVEARGFGRFAPQHVWPIVEKCGGQKAR
jgi:hypothetical protein